MDFPGVSDGKAFAYHAGDPGSIPGLGRSLGEGNGNPLQYYCQENPMDKGAWYAIVYGAAKSWARLSDFTFTFTLQYIYTVILSNHLIVCHSPPPFAFNLSQHQGLFQ